MSDHLITGNLGNREIQKSGNLEIWGPQTQEMKTLKIKIRAAQNVGKVWISRKQKNLPGPSQAHSSPSQIPGDLDIWESGIQTNPKNKNSQNQNPFRPKCRQGLDQ